MSVWKPPVHVAESPARWEANPDRATFFLEQLIDARNTGKFCTSPTVSVFNEISKLIWQRFGFYHTHKQLKNYYGNRKSFWAIICWARDRTGIGWDDSNKMILAPEDWWQSHEGKKGLMALKDKPIRDYELLRILFASQRAVADHIYGPYEPIPLHNDEGSGDSDNPDDSLFIDPQTQGTQGDTSMNISSGSKRKSEGSADPSRKKNKKDKNLEKDEYSPVRVEMAKRYHVFFDVRDQRVQSASRRMDFEPEANEASHFPSRTTVNSLSSMDRCMEVINNVLKLDPSSDFCYQSVKMLIENPDSQSAMLSWPDPVIQLNWLRRMVTEKFPGIELPNVVYDLNQPPL